MNKGQIIILILINGLNNILSISIDAQKIDIPKGIIYHYTSDQINEKAKKNITDAINLKTSSLVFDTPVMCGPKLWTELIQKNIIDSNAGIVLNFRIPIATNLITQKGRVLQTKKDFKAIWDYICAIYAGKKFTIRKLNTYELAYYWSIISYEIEEPLFIVEYNKQRLLLNLNNNKIKIMFIDNIN